MQHFKRYTSWILTIVCLFIPLTITITLYPQEQSQEQPQQNQPQQKSPPKLIQKIQQFQSKGIFLSDFIPNSNQPSLQNHPEKVIFHSNVIFFGKNEPTSQFQPKTAPIVTYSNKGRFIRRTQTITPPPVTL